MAFGCENSLIFHSGVGKTQLCLHLSTAVALSDAGNVLFVDTKNDFSSERLSQMIAANLASTDADAEAVRLLDRALDRVRVCKVDHLSTLTNVLFNVADSEVSNDFSSLRPWPYHFFQVF